ncbi:MAG: metallo-mystery pair system four-Cys motif protein [Deltaproteobacteria bacterium]|nr:metallo-mystery pair system four-Cys motif protein [Deltaproteobacteria bacterium]
MYRLAPLVLAVGLAGCTSGDPYSIAVQPLVGGAPFDCATEVTGLGTTDSSSWITHFRMFVHDVALITADGSEVPLELDEDGEWQGEGVALLDFDDGGGACGDANGQTNNLIVGTAPTGTEATGVAFTIGVPENLNHIDATTAAAPFNDTGLWWTWSGGYKWTRIDFENDAGDPFYFHHGATGCDGTPDTGFDCAFDNVTRIAVDMDPDSQVLALDLNAWFAENNFDAPVDFGAGDFVKGCMSFGGDPECQPIFNSMGINFEDTAPGPAQSVFTAMEAL